MPTSSRWPVTTDRVPPGPPGHPLIGSLPEFRRDPLGFLTSCARDYGDVVRYRIAHITAYLINHPDYIESVLTTHSRNIAKGRALQAGRGLLGDGLLISEGEVWRRQRRLAQPAFHRDRIAAYGEVIVDYAQRMLATWCDGETRDIHQEMIRLTLPIITQTLFNACVDDEADDVGAALHAFLEEFKHQIDTATLIPAWLPTPGRLRAKKAIERLEAIIYRLIRERRSQQRDNGDLLSMLLRAQDEDGGQMTDQQLRDTVMTLFLAGHETTAVTLTWTWYLLSMYPAIEEKLNAELQAVLGRRPPRVSDLPQLRYTEQVIKESLRLYPPAWVITRVALQDFEIGGYPVRAGTSLAMSQWVMQRDPRYYDQPDEFKPDRWTDEFDRRLPKFAYFPFGGGPRVCIGSSLAMMESILLLAAIAQQFRLTLAPGHPVKLWPSLTLHPEHGLIMQLVRRSASFQG